MHLLILAQAILSCASLSERQNSNIKADDVSGSLSIRFFGINGEDILEFGLNGSREGLILHCLNTLPGDVRFYLDIPRINSQELNPPIPMYKAVHGNFNRDIACEYFASVLIARGCGPKPCQLRDAFGSPVMTGHLLLHLLGERGEGDFGMYLSGSRQGMHSSCIRILHAIEARQLIQISLINGKEAPPVVLGAIPVENSEEACQNFLTLMIAGSGTGGDDGKFIVEGLKILESLKEIHEGTTPPPPPPADWNCQVNPGAGGLRLRSIPSIGVDSVVLGHFDAGTSLKSLGEVSGQFIKVKSPIGIGWVAQSLTTCI